MELDHVQEILVGAVACQKASSQGRVAVGIGDGDSTLGVFLEAVVHVDKKFELVSFERCRFRLQCVQIALQLQDVLLNRALRVTGAGGPPLDIFSIA